MPHDHLFDTRVFHFATELERLGALHAEPAVHCEMQQRRSAAEGRPRRSLPPRRAEPVTAAQLGATARRSKRRICSPGSTRARQTRAWMTTTRRRRSGDQRSEGAPATAGGPFQ